MAASKVNMRFVWGLVAVLCVLFGGAAGVLLFVKARSAEMNVARGDRKMQEGDYDAAEKFYAQAVNKAQQNVAWLTKWREAMVRRRPATEGQYFEAYRWLTTIHRALAVAGKTDVAAHRAYLDIRLREAESSGGRRESWDGLVAETEFALAYFDERDGSGWTVLRRYRGLARTALAGFEREVGQDQAAQARADLEAALAADPGDGASATAYQFWCRREADEARSKRDGAAEQAALERGRAAVTRAAATSPRDPRAVLGPLRFEVEAALRSVDPGRPPAEVAAERRSRLEALRPALAETERALRAADPALIDLARVYEFLTLSQAIDTGSGPTRALGLIDAVLGVRPESAELMFVRGRLLSGRGDHDEAIAQFQKVVELQVPPVSFEGAQLLGLQTQSVFQQANAALALAERAEAAARAAADARVEGFRAALAARVPADSPELLFIDAKRAIARNDLAAAQSLLATYSRVTADRSYEAFEALWLSGQVATRQGQPGLAVDVFQRAVDLRPESSMARMALGFALSQLQRYDEALRVYQSVLAMEPDHAEAKERAELLRAMQTTPESVTDPIRRALVEAEQLNTGRPRPPRDPDGAMRVLERAIAANGADPALSLFLAGLRAASNDAAGARDALRAGLARTPDHAEMKRVLTQLEAGESAEAALRLVDEMAKSDLDRAAGRYVVNRQFGRRDDARVALAQAAAIAPDDPRVIEWQFIEAIDRKDLDAAGPLADRARALNSDGVDGLTFRARLLIARKELTDAARSLEQAVERLGSNVALLRLLGNVRLALGRGAEALESYRAALRVNPADRETIKALVEALARLGQPDEALRTAREAEQFARADPEFLHMLFGLESMVGNRAAAIAGRERLRTTHPADARNGAALAALYLDVREWDKARTLIDELRRGRDTLELVGLDAAWYADQGDMEGARLAYTNYIDKLMQGAAEPMTAAPYLSMGSFLLARGQRDLGVLAIRRAADYQGPGREADVALGNALFALDRWEEAAAAFERALEAGAPDPDHAIVGRAVESLLMQRKPEDAAKRLAQVGPAVEQDATLLVLRAAIEDGRGDRRAARETLNRVVERFPNNQLAYYRRALLNGQDPAFRDDAMADLDQALRLAPGFWQARVARASLNLVRDRVDEAMADLKTAVEANPDLDELRFRLITDLIRRGRESEGFEVAMAGLRRRPNDSALAIAMGDLFSREALHARAAELYRSAWGAFKSGTAAALYVRELMRIRPPNLREAEGVLTAAGLPVQNSAELLMLRSRLRVLQGQSSQGEADAIAAYKSTEAETPALSAWYTDLLANFPDAPARLRILEGLPATGLAALWLECFRAATALGIPERRTQAVEELKRLGAAAAGDPDRAGYVYRTLEGALRDDRKWEEAAEACKLGAAASPDYVLHNNGAAILVEFLKRPEEALPYALKAVELAPAAFEVHDTLASVYLALKRPADAERSYREALAVAYRPAERAKALLPLSRLRIEAGDAEGGREFTAQIRRLLAADAGVLNDEQKRELDELERRAR